jgi:hypothetical protein
MTVHLGDMFGPGQPIRRYLLNSLDVELLEKYLHKYRCALSQHVHATCLTERTRRANATRVWPNSPRPLEDLEEA